MINQFGLTDEKRQIHEMARQFTASAITPKVVALDDESVRTPATVRR